MIISRRSFLWGLVAAPAIVHAGNLMPINPRLRHIAGGYAWTGWIEEVSRRSFLWGLVAAPAIVHAGNLMPINPRLRHIWHHIVACRQGNTARIYIDGLEVARLKSLHDGHQMMEVYEEVWVD